MRDILFRAKAKDTKAWIEGYYARESNHPCFANELKYTHFIFKDEFMDWGIGGLVWYEVIPETVGQYTGLTDKNGKRIFEGDIVSFKRINVLGYTTSRIGDVKYYDELPIFYIMATTGDVWDWVECEDIEVIGNIHDNPELIGGADNA